MMISDALKELVKKQVSLELAASCLYLEASCVAAAHGQGCYEHDFSHESGQEAKHAKYWQGLAATLGIEGPFPMVEKPAIPVDDFKGTLMVLKEQEEALLSNMTQIYIQAETDRCLPVCSWIHAGHSEVIYNEDGPTGIDTYQPAIHQMKAYNHIDQILRFIEEEGSTDIAMAGKVN